MEELINFRSLSDQLTQTEYLSFIQQIVIKSNGRNLINQALFIVFSKTPNQIAPFTNIIFNIIHKRQNNETSDQEPHKTTRIDQLPTSLISESASYLSTEDYIDFSTCNRKTYLSLHQQPRANECNLKNGAFLIKHPKSYSFSIFRNCEILRINTKHFSQSLSLKNQAIWKNNDKLKQLEIQNISDVQIFLLRKHIITDNLQYLLLSDFSNDQLMFKTITYQQFFTFIIDILSYFTMISSLSLSNITYNHPPSPSPAPTHNQLPISIQQKIKISFTNLKVLAITDSKVNSLKQVFVFHLCLQKFLFVFVALVFYTP